MFNNYYGKYVAFKQVVNLLAIFSGSMLLVGKDFIYLLENYFAVDSNSILSGFRITLSIVLILFLMLNAIEYKFYKGFKYGFLTFRLTRNLKKQLSESNSVFSLGAKERLPKIDVSLAKSLDSGVVKIENSIKFNRKFESQNISPALYEYVVESYYLSDDENYYIYNIANQDRFGKFEIPSFSAFHEYSFCNDKYKLGISKYDFINLQHMLITGQTGSGKSYFIYQLILQMCTKGIRYHLYFIDPKRSGLNVLGRTLGLDKNRNAVEYGEIVKTLRLFNQELNERKLLMNEKLTGRIDADYRDFNLEPHVLIFDEFAAFMFSLESKPKAERDEIKSYISSIVLMGRQLGFFVFISMQKSDAKLIDTAWRENLPVKIVFGNNDSTTYITTFGNGVQVPNRFYGVGEGVFIAPEITSIPKIFVAPTMKFDFEYHFKRLKNYPVGGCNHPTPKNILNEKGGIYG